MRSLFFIMLLCPILANAQINRSAKELASETIPVYITTKLFQGKPYKSVSYGDIKSCQQNNSGVCWSIEHKFEITEAEKGGGQTHSGQKLYKFLFYLDKKMNVLRAESFYSY